MELSNNKEIQNVLTKLQQTEPLCKALVVEDDNKTKQVFFIASPINCFKMIDFVQENYDKKTELYKYIIHNCVVGVDTKHIEGQKQTLLNVRTGFKYIDAVMEAFNEIVKAYGLDEDKSENKQ